MLVSIPDHLEVSSPSLAITGQAFSGQGIATVKIGDQVANTSNGFANWNLTLDSLLEGENVLTITATSFGSPATTRSITRTLYSLPEPVNPGGLADDWFIEHFGSLAAPNAGSEDDPDADGQTNLEEYLFGTNPLQKDQPVFTIVRDDQGIAIELLHRQNTGYTFSIEHSSDLVAWVRMDADLAQSSFSQASALVNSTCPLPGFSTAHSQFFRIKAAASP